MEAVHLTPIVSEGLIEDRKVESFSCFISTQLSEQPAGQ
jgi:hypothetical protein